MDVIFYSVGIIIKRYDSKSLGAKNISKCVPSCQIPAKIN